ncbi:hypothetical protein BX666DRAFT_2011016 [Dichotomocladium elegans]|nr:hypothetical protein BX666DRAFT_2011016 [Dichotomocladium elegans]
MADQVTRVCFEWVAAVKHLCRQTQSFAASADMVYDLPHGPIREFSQVSFDCIALELESQAQKWLDTRVQQYLRLFDKPSLLIAKRARRQLDDRERKDEFMVIHAQLVEELPRFLELASDLFDIVIADWCELQSETYQRLWQEWLRLARMLPADDMDQHHDQGIIRCYRSRIEPLLECLDSLVDAKRVSAAVVVDNLLTWEDFLRAGDAARI